MITMPDRLGEVAKAIESGESFDPKRAMALQTLDLIRAGRQFAEQAVKRDEDFDEQLKQDITAQILR